MFLYRITKEEENGIENDIQDAQNGEGVNQTQNSRQQQQNMSESRRRRNNSNNNDQQDEQEEEEEEEDEQSESQSQVQQDVQDNEQDVGQKKNKKKKIKRVQITEKISGFPLFFQKLSSTYFKIFSSVPKNTSKKKQKKVVKKKNEQQIKEDIQKNIIVNCKSNSFVSPRDAVSQNHFNFKDLNSDIRQQLSTRRNTKETHIRGDFSTKSKAKCILLPLNDPNLKKIAQQTEEMYQNFMQSERGIEIQKKIYQTNQEQAKKIGDQNLNYSLEELPKKHFDLEGPTNESQLCPEERGEHSNQESHQQDQTENGHTNNIQIDQTSINISNNHENDMKNSSKIRCVKNLKHITCDKENKEVTKQDNSISNVCVVCFDKVPDTLFMPCGHGGLCYDCAIDILKKTGECYLCRIAISEVYQVDIQSKRDKNYKVLAVTQIVEDISQYLESQIDINSQNQHNNIQQQLPPQQQQQQQLLTEQIQQQELMSASFHLQRQQVASPINSNRQSMSNAFSQPNLQPQIPQQIQSQQMQQLNNRNIQSPEKQPVENIEKSFQERYQQPNTLNTRLNYFQQEELQIDTADNQLDPIQAQVLVGAESSYKNSSSPINVEIAPPMQLIQFDSEEDENEIQKKQQLQNTNDTSIQQNKFLTPLQNCEQILDNQNKIQNAQSIGSQFQSNETCQIQEDETNSSEQETKNQEDFHKNSMRNRVFAEGSMQSIQKKQQEEDDDEIQLPTENS